MNICLRLRGGRLLGGGLEIFFLRRSKLGLREGYMGGTMVCLTGGGTGVAVLAQEDLLCDGKEPLEVRGGGSGAATIMELWIMEGYDVGLLIGVAVFVVIIILGG